MRRRSEAPAPEGAFPAPFPSGFAIEVVPATLPVSATVSRDTVCPPTEEMLDAAIRVVRTTETQWAAGVIACGRELARIRDRRLWTQRRGAPYGSFDDFVRTEFDRTSHWASGLIGLSAYGEEKLRRFGVTKMKAIASVPEERQPALEAMAETATTREVQAEAQRVKQETGYQRPSRSGKTDAATLARAEKRKQLIAEQEKASTAAAKQRVAARRPGLMSVPLMAVVTETITLRPDRAVTWVEESTDGDYVLHHKLAPAKGKNATAGEYRYTRTIFTHEELNDEEETA